MPLSVLILWPAYKCQIFAAALPPPQTMNLQFSLIAIQFIHIKCPVGMWRSFPKSNSDHFLMLLSWLVDARYWRFELRVMLFILPSCCFLEEIIIVNLFCDLKIYI
jgi:hypothetical protein